MNELKDRMQQALDAKGMTRSQLAKQAGIGISNIYNLFSGRNKSANPDTLDKIAKTLGVSVTWLIGFTPEMKNSESQKVSIQYFSCLPHVTEGGCTFDPTGESHTYLKEFFDKKGLSPGSCKLFRVDTHTMEPVIFRGNSILVNCADREPYKNVDCHVYAYVYNNSFRISYFEPKLDLITIKQPNDPPVSAVNLPLEKLSSIFIVGRVVEQFGDGGL